jgi:Ca-activated chloride channel family protein
LIIIEIAKKEEHMKRMFSLMLLLSITGYAFCMGSQSASSGTRGRYLAGQGLIMPPEEVYTDSYIASINYNYPQPEGDMGIYLYNSTNLMSRDGQEGILHIGIQGKNLSFAELPPMNLAFVIDTSSSMNEEDKIAWVRESAAIFMNKIRNQDTLALIAFNDTARVLFESTRMDSPQKRQRFLDAVNAIQPIGGTDLEAGLTLGYEQVLANYREGSVNRVLFFSDGTEFSSRLTSAGAQSGDVRISLLWNNRNDLDLHIITPRNEEIFYGIKKDSTGGMLDVDMNVNGETTKPVENVFWEAGKAPQGTYRVVVQNFGYHEPQRQPTSFQIELKNGNEYNHFEGVVQDEGKTGNVAVCNFTFKGATALKQEKALIYQLAETYREMGISISTLGVGVGFDLELMRQLAEEGGGSSRFLSSREEMLKTFDTEFERMAVEVARDLEMTLEFATGVEVLETWGYQHRIQRNRVTYRLSALHLGDYETILVRYRLPPQPQTAREALLATFRVQARDNFGKLLRPPEERMNITLTNDAATDSIASGMVLHSGTMMRFAESLKEIGALYYAGQDDLTALSQQPANRRGQPSAADQQRTDELRAAFLTRLETALSMTRDRSAELENARLRLDDTAVFSDELEILARYDGILSKELLANGGIVHEPPQRIAQTTNAPPVVPATPTANTAPISLAPNTPPVPPEMAALQTGLSSLFQEISLSFPANETPIVAIAPFAMRDGTEPPLLAYLNESAIVALSGTPRLTLVERSRLDAIRIEQNLQTASILDTDSAIAVGKLLGARYMITGQVIPMTSRVIVFGRVIQVETGEIISAAQVFFDRAIIGDLL